MSEDAVVMSGATKRTVTLWVAIAALVVGTLGAIFAVVVLPGLGDEPRPPTSSSTTPRVTATPVPAATPTDSGELAEDSAIDTIEAALAAPITTVGTSADLAELLKNVAIGSYAAELEAQWQELTSQGWTIDGSPTLVSAEVTSLDAEAEPPIATVTACLDSSQVTISDADGKSIGDTAAKMPRAFHLFTLTQGSDDIWRISGHSFPNDPKC